MEGKRSTNKKRGGKLDGEKKSPHNPRRSCCSTGGGVVGRTKATRSLVEPRSGESQGNYVESSSTSDNQKATIFAKARKGGPPKGTRIRGGGCLGCRKKGIKKKKTGHSAAQSAKPKANCPANWPI